MNKKTKSIVQIIVFVAIAVLLVWFSLRQVAPQKENVINAFRNANYFWVIVSVIISLFSHFLRAYRWNYLLNPLGYNISLVNSNCHVLVGYLANYIPPRIGELVRCTLATKYDKVPLQVAFGTVITERIVDTFVFLLIFVITLFAQFSNLIGLADEHVFKPGREKFGDIAQNPVKLIVVVAIVIVAVVGFIFLRKKIKGKFGNIIKGFAEGLGSIRKMEKPWTFVGLSLLIWICYFYSLYFCFFAIPGTSGLGHGEALVLLLFGAIGVIVAPGGVGAYQVILTSILLFTYNVDEVSAFALPWLSWGSQFVLLVAVGAISLIVLPLANRNKDVVS